MVRWDWNECYSNDSTIVRFECTGFSVDEKGENCRFQISDIPSEGRRYLAEKLRLDARDFEEWAHLDEAGLSRGNYFFVVSVHKAWYQCDRESWDWTLTAGNRAERAVYSCRGWKCDSRILENILDNRMSLSNIPSAGRSSLAKVVGLEENEFDRWAKDFKVWIEGDGFHVSVSVPNIWITANILAFDSSAIGCLAAVGGLIGSLGTSIRVRAGSEMMEITCRSFSDFCSTLSRYRENIWGFTLYAHGSKDGSIGATHTGSGRCYWQDDLIREVRRIGYKLGKINLMQCFSGYEGKAEKIVSKQKNETLDNVRERLEKVYKDLSYISIDSLSVSSDSGNSNITDNDSIQVTVKITVHWSYEWSSLAVKLDTYQGMNVCLLDTYFFEKLFQE